MNNNRSIIPENQRRRVVMVTGASGGLGKATVNHFLSKGWSVVATARALGNLPIGGATSELLHLQLDLSDEGSIQSAVAQAEAQFGQIDVLVNNAGAGLAGPLESIDASTLRRHFEINVIGTASVMKAVLPSMRLRKAGTIVNVSSVAGRLGLPFMAPYAASKFALEGMSESLRYELAPFGIKVRLVEPSGIRTRFTHEWISGEPYDRQIATLRKHMENGMARAALPEKVAHVIYRAAVSAGSTLRFTTPDASALLMLKALLPDSVMQALMRAQLLTP